jgi:hypothetical protein
MDKDDPVLRLGVDGLYKGVGHCRIEFVVRGDVIEAAKTGLPENCKFDADGNLFS